MRSVWTAGIGGVAAAFLGALCCGGPLLFVAFGVGAGLASIFEPLRPIFTVIMIGALGFGFYVVHGRPSRRRVPPERRSAGVTCAVPDHRVRDRLILWSATVIAAILWSLPYWLTLFI